MYVNISVIPLTLVLFIYSISSVSQYIEPVKAYLSDIITDTNVDLVSSFNDLQQSVFIRSTAVFVGASQYQYTCIVLSIVLLSQFT